MDRGAWQVAVHRVAEGQTRLKRQHSTVQLVAWWGCAWPPGSLAECWGEPCPASVPWPTAGSQPLLQGLCKLGSAGGTDFSMKQFAEGSTLKLAKQCRK